MVGGRDAVDVEGHDNVLVLEVHWWRLLNWSLAVAVVMVEVHLCKKFVVAPVAEAASEAAVLAEEAFEETKAVGLYLKPAGFLYLTKQPHLH